MFSKEEREKRKQHKVFLGGCRLSLREKFGRFAHDDLVNTGKMLQPKTEKVLDDTHVLLLNNGIVALWKDGEKLSA